MIASGESAQECVSGAFCCRCAQHALKPSSEEVRPLPEDQTPYACDCNKAKLIGTEYPFPQREYLRSPRKSHEMLLCPDGTKCAGATGQYEDDGSLQDGDCMIGYAGRLCGECAEGYYEVKHNCEACPEKGNGLAFLMFTAFVIVIISLMIYAITQGWQYFKCGALSILFDFLQTVGTYMGYNLNWPDLVMEMINMSTLANIDMEVIGANCFLEIKDWYKKWSLDMVTPLFVLLGFGILYTCFRILTVLELLNVKKGQLYQSCTINAGLFALSVGYTRMTRLTCSFFYCKTFGEGTNYLVAKPSVECYTDVWWRYSPIAFGGIAVYILGIPILFALILRHYKDRMENPAVKNTIGAIVICYAPHVRNIQYLLCA
ncbi:hypothetical protein CYMTET_41203 [Cymbomonas tetramitiformis]|uniref:Uncharacterized protein n=1 Tax=Cymbomonas tetramitiformis TaxID=36881 RepID=A0AAE0C7Y2_9CHLO|nr:hypothetical protein CYMTET_41203 [Cymbomonas tetramitiformis]